LSPVGRDRSVWVPVPADEFGFVRFETAPAAGDPLVEHVRLVDPRKRSRLRLDGRRATVEAGLELSTADVFPGRPNYSQQRSFERSVADEGAERLGGNTAERAAGRTSGNPLRWSPEERSPLGSWPPLRPATVLGRADPTHA
jgi:hypothetical protein